jgi:4-hydroxybenzoate polyprenyltransferase
MLLALLRAARPHQWLKNVFFVGAPLVFAHRLDEAGALLRAGFGVLCFCALSSSVYLLNDLLDVEKDRVHPTKRRRPIAAGTLPVPVAKAAALGAAAAALGVGFVLGREFAVWSLAYLVLNLGYSFGLKHVAFLDVTCISTGFLLRVLGGAAAVPVPASGWLLSCTMLLAALLGFGKRAHELRVAGERGASQRAALGQYNATVLRVLLILLALLTTGLYAAYTQSAHALSLFGTRLLVITVPNVAFGIARFLWITNGQADAESPTDSMLRDRWMMGNLLLYATLSVAIIYPAR